jgi:hypothetical protein
LVTIAIITSFCLALSDDTPYHPQFVMTASVFQPTGAALLARGVCRTLEQLAYVSLTEFPSPTAAAPIFSLSARRATS